MRIKRIIGMGLLSVVISLSSAEAGVVKKSAELCRSIRAEVTAVAVSNQDNTARKIIDYALDGARSSCRMIHEDEAKSQTRQLNTQAGKTAVSVGLDLQYLLPRIIYLSQLTFGAFDPLAWSAGKSVAYKDIWFDQVGRRAMLRRKGGRLSLRGLIKGYLADRITARMRQKGLKDYVVTVGKSVIKAAGGNLNSSWMTGIPDPHYQNQDVVCRVALVNRSLVTVGDYSWELGADTFPGASSYISVSVLAPDAHSAEALANAAMVSGSNADQLIQRIPGAGAVLIPHQGPLRIVGSVPAACMY